MIKSINATLNIRKNKILAFVLSGTLILALGSGVAYAASGAGTIFPNGLSVIAKADNGNGTIIEDIEVRALSDEDGVSVRAIARANEDGTLRYSTDGGKTWSKEVPAGWDGFTFSVNQDGNSVSGKFGN